MASGNATSQDNEFEPDNHFFDNFLDGMDVLIDKCRDSEDEEWLAGGTADEESDTSSGADRMVIDLPSSPESGDAKLEGSDIKAILTSRVLAQLEKTSSQQRNVIDSTFPSNQLVVDVLDRLKKSAQQKNESFSSGTGTGTISQLTTLKNAKMENQTGSSEQDKDLQFNFYEEILSNQSAEYDEKKIPVPHETTTTLLKWMFSKEAKSRTGQVQSSSSHDGRDHGYHNVYLEKNRNKRKRHKKRTSRNEEHSKKRKHHKKKSRKKPRKENVKNEKSLCSDPSLESVSSEDEDDVLNIPLAEGSADEPMVNSAGCPQSSVKKLECEEGEVLSSSSDCKSERVVKKRRTELRPRQIRTEYFSPPSSSDGTWPRRYQKRRSSSPSSSWCQRLRPEEHGRYVIRRLRSPVHYIGMSPWREQQGDGPRAPIPSRPRSLSPETHTRPRTPNNERIPGEFRLPFIRDFGSPNEMLPSRRIHLPSYLYRPQSPREAVQKSGRLYKTIPQTEIHPREKTSCPKLRIERRLLHESGTSTSERREKSSLLLRCLREIRHRSYKPGRFIYNPDLKGPFAETNRLINRYSSPLHLNQSQTPRLKFTSPTIRHVGTSTSSLLQKSPTSIGYQTDRPIFSADQVQKYNSPVQIPKFSSIISGVTKTTSLTITHLELPAGKSDEISPQRHRVPFVSNAENVTQEFVSHVSVLNLVAK